MTARDATIVGSLLVGRAVMPIAPAPAMLQRRKKKKKIHSLLLRRHVPRAASVEVGCVTDPETWLLAFALHSHFPDHGFLHPHTHTPLPDAPHVA